MEFRKMSLAELREYAKEKGIRNISTLKKAELAEENGIRAYASYDARVCPMCKAKQKIDAIVNGFGYSKM